MTTSFLSEGQGVRENWLQKIELNLSRVIIIKVYLSQRFHKFFYWSSDFLHLLFISFIF